MKRKSYRFLTYLLIFFLLSSSFSSKSYAGSNKKILLVLIDELGEEELSQLNKENMGIALMNNNSKTKDEFLLSINAGRNIAFKKNLDISLKEYEGGIKINDYDQIYKEILSSNNNIKPSFMGDKINISYIGNRDSALLASNSKGEIYSGKLEIKEDRTWIKSEIEEEFQKSDLVILNFEKTPSVEVLNYIVSNSTYNTMILSKSLSDDYKSIINRNLMPFLYYRDKEPGLLTSKSTNREGFITIEDISKEILLANGKASKEVGNLIITEHSSEPVSEISRVFKEAKNMFILASVYHAMVYISQFILAIYLIKKKDLSNFQYIFRFLISNFLVSFLMVGMKFPNIFIYILINFILTFIVSKYVFTEKDSIYKISFLIYLSIVFIMFTNKNAIYNSYLGFNNLFYGARYYGFNNGIMAVLLSSSLMTYFFLTKEKGSPLKTIVLSIIIFLLNIIILSSQLGANTGGFISAVLLFLIILYLIVLDKKLNMRTFALLLFLGAILFALNMYFDSKSMTKSHAIRFIERIRANGIVEFVNMLFIKITEFIKFTLMPPFSIVFLSQLIALKELNSSLPKEVTREIKLLFILGLITFFINDTGIISIIYINVFILANILAIS